MIYIIKTKEDFKSSLDSALIDIRGLRKRKQLHHRALGFLITSGNLRHFRLWLVAWLTAHPFSCGQHMATDTCSCSRCLFGLCHSVQAHVRVQFVYTCSRVTGLGHYASCIHRITGSVLCFTFTLQWTGPAPSTLTLSCMSDLPSQGWLGAFQWNQSGKPHSLPLTIGVRQRVITLSGVVRPVLLLSVGRLSHTSLKCCSGAFNPSGREFIYVLACSL